MKFVLIINSICKYRLLSKENKLFGMVMIGIILQNG